MLAQVVKRVIIPQQFNLGVQMQITITDRKSFAVPSQREYTDEGFLRVPGRVARDGVQEYLASELGLDGDPNRIVKVYRPAEEVFAQESLDSYHGVDVTIEHPGDMVNAENYKAVTAGVVRSGGIQDGNHVKVEMIIKAADAIKAVESGKAELSAGYTAIYDDNVPDELASQGIEFIQRNIRINHVALVDRARAGASARLFDGKKGVPKMPISVTLDSKRSVEVEDKATAALISDTLESLNKRVADAEAAQAKAEAERDEAMEEKEKADKKASDSAIDALEIVTGKQALQKS